MHTMLTSSDRKPISLIFHRKLFDFKCIHNLSFRLVHTQVPLRIWFCCRLSLTIWIFPALPVPNRRIATKQTIGERTKNRELSSFPILSQNVYSMKCISAFTYSFEALRRLIRLRAKPPLGCSAVDTDWRSNRRYTYRRNCVEKFLTFYSTAIVYRGDKKRAVDAIYYVKNFVRRVLVVAEAERIRSGIKIKSIAHQSVGAQSEWHIRILCAVANRMCLVWDWRPFTCVNDFELHLTISV